jgi:hypothetical protein
VITADLTYGYAERISDFEGELVDDFGHWSVEQRSKLVLDRIPGVLSSRNLNYGGAFRGRVACIV